MQAALRVGILLVPLLSGCAAPPPPATAPPGVVAGTHRLELSQCTGFTAATLPAPDAIALGRPPAGWEAKNPPGASNVAVMGYECRRIGIGPLERGPVRIAWDGHNHFTAPPRCESRLAAPLVLNAFLVDDGEVAAYLRDAYGMPASYAEFEIQAQAGGSAVQRTWSWKTPGQPASRLVFVDDGTNQTGVLSDVLFWQRGDGLGQLNVSYARSGSTHVMGATEGSMQPPMLLAETPHRAFVGGTTYFRWMSGEGAFTLYRDLLCQQVEAEP